MTGESSTNKPLASGPSEREIEESVYRVLRSQGLLAPETVDEVLAAEQEIAEEQLTLPEGLRNCDRVFQQQRPLAPSRPLFATASPETRENFACAARGSCEVPPDVEQRMHDDRQREEERIGECAHTC